jgi:hypothetical protein
MGLYVLINLQAAILWLSLQGIRFSPLTGVSLCFINPLVFQAEKPSHSHSISQRRISQARRRVLLFPRPTARVASHPQRCGPLLTSIYCTLIMYCFFTCCQDTTASHVGTCRSCCRSLTLSCVACVLYLFFELLVVVWYSRMMFAFMWCCDMLLAVDVLAPPPPTPPFLQCHMPV